RTQPEIIWHYIGLVFWPRDLCFDYVWRVQSNPWIYLSLGGVIVAIISAALFGYSRSIAATRSSSTSRAEAATSASSGFAVGLASWMTLTFFFVLAPTSSIVPIRDLAFEHRMYLPSAFIVAAVILVSWSLIRRMLESSNQPNVLRLGVATMAIAVLLMLGFRTHLRNLDYQSGQRLWQSAVEASPKNPRAWYNLGQVLFKRGDKDEALEPMIKAVGYSTEPVAIYDVGLAGCLLHAGRMDDAIKLYKRAIRNKADYSQAFNDLGVIYLKRKEFDQARSYFTQASELGNAEAFYNLGWIERKQDAFDDAERHFRKALALQANLGSAARQVAWLTATRASVSEQELVSAKGLLEKHYDLTVTKSSGALDTAAVIAARQGKLEAAVEYSKQALAAAQANDQPDEDWVAELKERLACYKSGEAWLRSPSQ
ncbi:MAG: tetratricopeptide repeat protein, partial [Planctomycetota bacterium]